MSVNTSPFASGYRQADVAVSKRETVYKGFFRIECLTLRHRLFNGGWSREFTRELFVRGDAVGVLLYDPRRDLIGLVEQFRVGALDQPSPWCLEVVAGMVEPGETPEAVARRELQEEAGIGETSLEFICHYLPSPGGSDEGMSLFCACCDLEGRGGVYGVPEENEDIRFHVLPAEEVFSRFPGEDFNNAAVLICLMWLQLHRQRLQLESQSLSGSQLWDL